MKPVALAILALAVVAAGAVGIAWKTMGDGTDFPASLYPRPASYPDWGPPSGCPSLDGVDTIGREWKDALPVLSKLGTVSEHEDLRLSDRALWPVIRENWSDPARPAPQRTLRPEDVVGGDAAHSLESDLVSRHCGRATLAQSVWIAVCPVRPQGRCNLSSEPALTEQYLLLRRRGHWLVWWMRP